MNILILTTHVDIGGITSYVLSLAKGLKKKGHTVYVGSSGGKVLQTLQDAGITTCEFKIRTKQEFGPKVIFAIPSLLRFIRQNNIDIVHTHTRVTHVLAGITTYLTGTKHVSTYHGFFKHIFIRRLFPFMGERVIAISQSVREYLIQDLMVSPERIALIHNGIDFDHFKNTYTQEELQNIRRSYGLKENSQVIGIIGRLSEIKGHPHLLNACAQLYEHNKNIEVLIVGEGRIQGELMTLANDLQIDDIVHFKASEPDTRIPLGVTDIFVMPSLMEGFGLALLEAMAMGKAVVASRIGGITDIIHDKHNGLLVPPDSIPELATAIDTLLNDTTFKNMIESNAPSTIFDKFSIDKTIHKTLNVYNKVFSN
ncbi:MAG: glycosyltransferase family 4 protein [Candidatus Ancaeobacter aquaticus]|nr:glycosyltransferase family 4 protein [Candidatus Ancaeobacter aquaticus]